MLINENAKAKSYKKGCNDVMGIWTNTQWTRFTKPTQIIIHPSAVPGWFFSRCYSAPFSESKNTSAFQNNSLHSPLPPLIFFLRFVSHELCSPFAKTDDGSEKPQQKKKQIKKKTRSKLYVQTKTGKDRGKRETSVLYELPSEWASMKRCQRTMVCKETPQI